MRIAHEGKANLTQNQTIIYGNRVSETTSQPASQPANQWRWKKKTVHFRRIKFKFPLTPLLFICISFKKYIQNCASRFFFALIFNFDRRPGHTCADCAHTMIQSISLVISDLSVCLPSAECKIDLFGSKVNRFPFGQPFLPVLYLHECVCVPNKPSKLYLHSMERECNPISDSIARIRVTFTLSARYNEIHSGGMALRLSRCATQKKNNIACTVVQWRWSWIVVCSIGFTWVDYSQNSEFSVKLPYLL